jgi:hypothetical protein
MLTVYFTIECPKCEEDIFYRVGTTEERNGDPVIPYDMLAQTQIDCDHCDESIYFGDIEYLTEDEL